MTITRPNHVVTASYSDSRLVLYGLYYSVTKAGRAYKELQKRRHDGSYAIRYEDGRLESIYGIQDELIVKLRFLGDHIWTSRDRWRKSFIDITEEEYEELSVERDIPVKVLKEIANLERDYFEKRHDARWNAFKRAYLPRFLYNLI